MLFGERCLHVSEIDAFINDPDNANDFVNPSDTLTYSRNNIEMIYLHDGEIIDDGMPFLVVYEESRIRKYFYVRDNVDVRPAMQSCYPTYTISYYNRFEKTLAFNNKLPSNVLIGPGIMD